MAQQFPQNSFSHAPHQQNGYLYDEPKPTFWRFFVPVGVVLLVGALAYSAGKVTSARMTNQIQTMGVQQVPASLVQKSVIGADAPEIMVPQPTIEPQQSTFLVKSNANHVAKRSVPQVTRPKNQVAATPVEERSIPFQQAESFPAGVEPPDVALANTELSRNEMETPSSSGQGEDKPTAEPITHAPGSSPVPVPESPGESAKAQ